jgi:hypothetical protein
LAVVAHPLRLKQARTRASGVSSKLSLPDLPGRHPTHLPHVNQRVGWATILRPPIARPHQARVATIGRLPERRRHRSLSITWPAWTRPKRYRNINRSSIDYALRPRLRSRLTLGGLTFPRNPWAYGGRVFHPSFATHAGIRTRQASTARFPGCFTRLPTLPYPPAPLHPDSSPSGQRLPDQVVWVCGCRSFGGVLEPRYIVGAESLDQ